LTQDIHSLHQAFRDENHSSEMNTDVSKEKLKALVIFPVEKCLIPDVDPSKDHCSTFLFFSYMTFLYLFLSFENHYL